MQKRCSVISIKHKKKNTNIDRYENDGKGLFGKIGKVQYRTHKTCQLSTVDESINYKGILYCSLDLG